MARAGTITFREGDTCPQEGCTEPLVWCDCGQGVPEGLPAEHLICLGCGQDADDGLCDCAVVERHVI